MMIKPRPWDEAQRQVEEMMIGTIVALAVEALALEGKPTVKEAYTKQIRSRRSRNEQILVRHQNNNNGK